MISGDVQSHYISNNHILLSKMEKKSGKHNQKDKPNWDWSHIECYLKTVQSNRKTPSIILTNPSTESAGPNVRLYIDTEKSLQYSSQLGWNWHKSWNIPNISLRLQIKDQTTGDFLLSPRNLYAQIFAVKKNTENQKTDRMTLVDVGIRGESKMEMIDGQVYFSAIKFSSTTYNNEGINFNLLIVLYINQGEFEKPKVLTAVISPPIFVDSRRSARDYQQKKFSSFVEPFGYDNIEKEFIKRENKSKCESQIVIKNDPQGFYNYITAPNIRHKVKHPVFLTIKFSNCVKIYYNSKLVDNTNLRDMLQNLQTRLLKQNKNKQKNEGDITVNLDDKFFVFVVSNLTDSLKRKKVIESIQTMQNEFIGITCAPQELLDIFLPIDSIDELKKAYKDTYQSLMNICQNYEPEYPQESEDQYYSDQYQQSDKSSKKVKRDPAGETQKINNQKNKTTIISNKPNKEEKISENLREKSKEKQKEKPDTVLKKEQLFQSQFQAPVFYGQNDNQQLFSQKKSNAPSAFNKAVGFRNVSENNPIFDTSHLNKAFSSNMMGFQFGDLNNMNNSFMDPNKNSIFKSQKISQNHLLSQNNHGFTQQTVQGNQGSATLGSGLGQNGAQLGNSSAFSMANMNQGIGQGYGNSIYDNLLYSNLMLTNWLTSVKNNNNSLYDSMMHHNLADQIIHKNNMDRYMQADQQQKILEMNRLPLQSEEQQSIICLIQQISLYKELLSQVTYQNQLLSRDITIKQHSQQPEQSHLMKYQQQQAEMRPFGNMSSGVNGNMMGMNFMQSGMQSGIQSNMSNGIQNNMQNGIQNNMQNGMQSGISNSMQNSLQGGLQGLSGQMGGMAGMQGMSNIQNIQGLLGNGNMMANSGQINLNSMMNQNRTPENAQKNEKLDQSYASNLSLGGGMNGPKIDFGIQSAGQNVSANFGPSYQMIKNMIIEQMKKQAELKQQQK